MKRDERSPARSEPEVEIPISGFRTWVRELFLDEEPNFSAVFVPLCVLSLVLYLRHPLTNFIFDEQEALLGNPYVRSVADPNGTLHWMDAFRRDFWGLLPAGTIGSYRPIPNLIWRFLWMVGARDRWAFPYHCVNVFLHALNGTLLVLFTYKLTRDRALSWVTGVLFVATAVVTEAVTGVVGIADVLGGLGAILALLSLTRGLVVMPILVFSVTLLGLFSKESALCTVPLIPLAAALLAREVHPRPRAWLRALLAAAATGGAFVLYVELRRRLFPVSVPAALSPEVLAEKGAFERFFGGLLRWYAQPVLPRDPLNNPLIDASFPLRVAGALRVYARGVWQVVCPWTLSGDYSAPQEPVPGRLLSVETVAGGLLLLGPLAAALGLVVVRAVRKREGGAGQRVALWLTWIVVSYLPVSNIPIVLPTVRAERFWYFPAIATSSLLALLFVSAARRAQGARWARYCFYGATLYVAFQCISARRHANDYKDDLTFWDATRRAAPRSAKAHLNYSVMLGARGNNPGRLEANKTALLLAPRWPMASIYMGDVLCRMHRTDEAIPHYLRGFRLGPGDQALISLAVQCLWDEGNLANDSLLRDELELLIEPYPGSWLHYIVRDTLDRGADQGGVDPQYRPRGYNEGPKKT